MEFIETPIFTKDIVKIISETEYYQLQTALIENPCLGIVIPEGHGLRKLRWSTEGKGKRGGVRIIYYLAKDEIIYFMSVYKKSRQENLSKERLKQMAGYVKEHLL